MKLMKIADDVVENTNMASAFYESKDYNNTLKHYKLALKLNTEVVGKYDAINAIIYNNIALSYYSQGDYASALECFYTVLYVRENINMLGAEHPDTVEIYKYIAFTYYKMGDYEKALEYFRKTGHDSTQLNFDN